MTFETEQKITALIAEVSGKWLQVKISKYGVFGDIMLAGEVTPTRTEVNRYATDLNAVHDLEMELSDEPVVQGGKSERTRYREELCVVTAGAGGPITASALHRIEAYIAVKAPDRLAEFVKLVRG